MTKDEEIKGYDSLFEKIKKAIKNKVSLIKDRYYTHRNEAYNNPNTWAIFVQVPEAKGLITEIEVSVWGKKWAISMEHSRYKKDLDEADVLPELKKAITAVKNGLEYHPETKGFISTTPSAWAGNKKTAIKTAKSTDKRAAQGSAFTAAKPKPAAKKTDFKAGGQGVESAEDALKYVKEKRYINSPPSAKTKSYIERAITHTINKKLKSERTIGKPLPKNDAEREERKKSTVNKYGYSKAEKDEIAKNYALLEVYHLWQQEKDASGAAEPKAKPTDKKTATGSAFAAAGKPKPTAKPEAKPKPKAKPKNSEPQPPTKRVENKIKTREKRVTKTQDELAQLKKELAQLKHRQGIIKI